MNRHVSGKLISIKLRLEFFADLTAHTRTERTGHTHALAFGGLADWKILCGG